MSPKADCLCFAKRPKFPLSYLGDRCGAPRGLIPQIRIHIWRRGPNARTAATDRGSLAQGEEEEITCSNCSTSYPTLLDANHTPALLLFNNSSPKYNYNIQRLRRLTCCIWGTASACPSVASGRCP